MYAGKSSIASALSKKLQIPEVPLDYIAGYYYVKQGIDLLALANIMKSQNFKDYVDFMRAYELNAAVQVATEFQEGIISFGGGHSYFTDQEQLQKLLAIKELSPNIFLLLPSEDENISQKVLDGRMVADRKKIESEEKLTSRKLVNKLFIESESNKKLANHTILTEGKDINAVAEEIMRKLSW